MPNKTNNIAIIGAGAWGSAIAVHLSKNNHKIILYCRNNKLAKQINTDNENKKYLPNVKLNTITATSDISLCENADIIFITTPSQHMRSMVKQIKLTPTTEIVICCKGIENDTLQTMAEVVCKYFPNNNITVFSGPTFAIEVARGLPTVASLAGKNTNNIKSVLTSQNLRIYTTTDIVGVEVLGTIKNVLAIACGIVAGKQLGDNAKASVITRGLAEATRLCVALGGSQDTVLSPAGIGDLILTASSMQSRNMSFGFELGQGKSTDEILKSRTTITEGVANTKSIINLANNNNIKMPICNALYNIIYNNTNIDDEIKELLNKNN